MRLGMRKEATMLQLRIIVVVSHRAISPIAGIRGRSMTSEAGDSEA
jgi:hypothetical protein